MLLRTANKRKFIEGFKENKMKCKNCGRKFSGKAFHFSNQIAIKKGYCWIGCMMKDLGADEAFNVLQKCMVK